MNETITFGKRRLIAAFLPLFVYIASWTFLTAVGAAFALLPAGRVQLFLFLGRTDPSVAEHIGSITYFALLLLPYIVVPCAAVLAYRATSVLRISIKEAYLESSQLILYIISVAAIGYVIFSFARSGHLIPTSLLQGARYEKLMTDRAAVISDLHFLPYAAMYAIIPMASVMFLTRLIGHGFSKLDAIGLAVTFLATYYFTFAIYMKAPLLIYFSMLILVVLYSGRGYWLVPGIIVLAAVTFLSQQVLIGGFFVPIKTVSPPLVASNQSTNRGTTSKPPAQALPPPRQRQMPPSAEPHTGSPTSKLSRASPGAPHGNASTPKVTPVSPVGANTDTDVSAPRAAMEVPSPIQLGPRSLWRRYEVAAVNTIQSFAFRMGSAFPVYVAVFSRPNERCGLETAGFPFIPKPKCIVARKVSDAMYPWITWVRGFAPAAAHVSAYGELGMWYAIVVLVLIGIFLGVLGTMITSAAGPTAVGLGVASAVYAYFLTQVPLIGATISYAYSLILLLLVPIACASCELIRKRHFLVP